MTQLTRKTIFDTVRHMLGRGFRQSEVNALDGAIDRAINGIPDAPENVALDRVPGVPHCRIGTAGIALIKQFEGCARMRSDGLVEAYPDPGTGGDPWTIGWGSTGRDLDGVGRIDRGTVWSKADCDARLERDLVRYAEDVAEALGDAPTSQPQFDALTSFHYNTGAIARATLTRLHKAGDYAGAEREFARWVHAGGRVLPGLVRRRKAEAALYRSGS